MLEIRLLRRGLRAGEDEAEAAECHADTQEVHQQAAVLRPVLWDRVRSGTEAGPGSGERRVLQYRPSPPGGQMW